MSSRVRTYLRNSSTVESTMPARLLGATSLTRYYVYDAAGKCLGKIVEIVLDVRTGCVRYAVLALGGFLGIGQKRVALPWSALSPDAETRRCIVDVPQMLFMAVPVPPNDPWLQQADLTLSKEHAKLARQQGFLGAMLQKRMD